MASSGAARGIQHEVRSVFAHKLRGLVNQPTIFGFNADIQGFPLWLHAVSEWSCCFLLIGNKILI